ncbi:hypothetical protein [uncultured Sphaerochaeta sp.]|uniref:hypothetical protein n=1 Tax=uncultured Sphaerochaeta sp. TaxID=886478 RepID=UPI0029CA4624|nr:hypothetical protein [uncultured Sphaerochaeta sp.]
MSESSVVYLSRILHAKLSIQRKTPEFQYHQVKETPGFHFPYKIITPAQSGDND